MKQLLRNLTLQELLEKLANLTARLCAGRGMDKAHEFCRMDIEEIQKEIESRKEIIVNNQSTKNKK